MGRDERAHVSYTPHTAEKSANGIRVTLLLASGPVNRSTVKCRGNAWRENHAEAAVRKVECPPFSPRRRRAEK